MPQARMEDERGGNTGSLGNGVAHTEPVIREDWTGLSRWRRLVVPKMPGNAGVGKEP